MSRKLKFENHQYYHVFNRGVDKRPIFLDESDYKRFIESFSYFNQINAIGSIYYEKKRNLTKKMVASGKLYSFPEATHSKKLVKIHTYNLLPNHFHLILKQSRENGISEFIKKICTGHSQYFNNKYKRSGSLFQGRFKAVHINTDAYLIWLIAYILGNSEIHNIEKYHQWPYSSLDQFHKSQAFNNLFCDKKNFSKYIKFVIKKAKENKIINKCRMEN